MQISAGFNPLTASTAQYSAQQGSAAVLEAAAPPAIAETVPSSDGTATEATAVKLSADPKPVNATGTYAEIWRDGQKVAEVDLYGGVTSLNGMIAPLGGGGGPQMAARRASQIALAVGGEIRSAGQVIDRQTLLMRDRLQRAYTL